MFVQKKYKKASGLYRKGTIINKILISLMIVFLLVLFVFGIPIIINELYKLDTGYFTLWGASDILSYYAVILSGIITIGALIVTIHHNKKETEKHIQFSKSQINVPFFVIEKVYQINNSDIFDKSENGLTWQIQYIINKYGNNQGEFIITLKNIGDGIAISPEYDICLSQNYEKKTIPKFINKGDDIELIYDLQKLLELKFGTHKLSTEFDSFNNSISLCYQNTLGIKFTQEITIQHKFVMENNSINLLINDISPQKIIL